MSAEALVWAFAQDVKPSGAKLILVTLADAAAGDVADVTTDYLVSKTSLGQAEVTVGIETLQQRGFIAIERFTAGADGGESRRIKLLMGGAS